MMRTLARLILTLVMAGSLAVSGLTLARIAQNPLLLALVDRSTAEIVAATDQAMARAATPERIVVRLESRLAEAGRNWVAIDGLPGATAEGGIKLPPDLERRLDLARAAATGLWATASACAACAFDPAAGTLSATLICQAPMVFTPLGDLAGLTLEAGRYAAGAEVDRINLTLSLAGLAGAGLVLATGGSSATLKIGASAAKLARKMGLVSPRLSRLMLDAARNGVDWAALPSARSRADVSATLRPAVLQRFAFILTRHSPRESGEC